MPKYYQFPSFCLTGTYAQVHSANNAYSGKDKELLDTARELSEQNTEFTNKLRFHIEQELVQRGWGTSQITWMNQVPINNRYNLYIPLRMLSFPERRKHIDGH